MTSFAENSVASQGSQEGDVRDVCEVAYNNNFDDDCDKDSDEFKKNLGDTPTFV